jgi:hypothetical protein
MRALNDILTRARELVYMNLKMKRMLGNAFLNFGNTSMKYLIIIPQRKYLFEL